MSGWSARSPSAGAASRRSRAALRNLSDKALWSISIIERALLEERAGVSIAMLRNAGVATRNAIVDEVPRAATTLGMAHDFAADLISHVSRAIRE